MFKIAGSIMIITASIFIFNKNSFTYFFTYSFFKHITEILKNIDYEFNTNISYEELFEKINFHYKKDMENYSKNIFIKNKELKEVNEFFINLGKRDRVSERQYIKNYIDVFKNKYIEYFNKYKENQKTNLIYGISFGIVIIILIS